LNTKQLRFLNSKFKNLKNFRKFEKEDFGIRRRTHFHRWYFFATRFLFYFTSSSSFSFQTNSIIHSCFHRQTI